MFDITLTLMSQLVDLLPGIIGLWVIFDFTGALLFGNK